MLDLQLVHFIFQDINKKSFYSITILQQCIKNNKYNPQYQDKDNFIYLTDKAELV